MDGRRAVPDTRQGASPPRPIWRLFSPSASIVCCEVDKAVDGFEMRVQRDEEIMFTCHAQDLEKLHLLAAGWRVQLESNGYAPVAGIAATASPSRRRSCEMRTAFIGLVQCAELLESSDANRARALRDHATAGLVAVALRDSATTRETISAARQTLDGIRSEERTVQVLLKSCHALVDRLEGSVEFPDR